MITMVRSPLRVSFFGGGSDYPEYFSHFPGAVLGAAINKYIYTIILPMVGFAETRYRITYRTVEAIDRIEDIQHNVIRVVLQELHYDRPLNIAILSDIPGNSGLGSSSSFTVGFTKLIEHLRGKKITKLDLVKQAFRFERDLLRENVGVQDQTHAAFGGLNFYTFHRDSFTIKPVQMTSENRQILDQSLVLVYSGTRRQASRIVEEQLQNTRERKNHKELEHLVALSRQGLDILETKAGEDMLRQFGELLSEGWQAKRALSSTVSTPKIDEIYQAGMQAGAYGGKLCGAGGGGFFLFLAPPQTAAKFQDIFGADNVVKIEIEDDGASIINR